MYTCIELQMVLPRNRVTISGLSHPRSDVVYELVNIGAMQKTHVKKVSAGIIKESILNNAINSFNNYDEYLDSMILEEDLFFLEDLGFARQLVELGIINHFNSAIIPRALFVARKQEQLTNRLKHVEALMESRFSTKRQKDPLLAALSEREDSNRKRTVLTIIYLRVLSRFGFEISGYIDFNQRLELEDFSVYWSERRLLRPLRSDLSYVAWRSQGPVCSTASRNFIVLTGGERALALRCRLDGRTVQLHPKQEDLDREIIPVSGNNGILQAELIDYVVKRGSA